MLIKSDLTTDQLWRAELNLLAEQGIEMDDLSRRVETTLAVGALDEGVVEGLWVELETRAGLSTQSREPSDLAGILQRRPKRHPHPALKLGSDELYDRIYGAWLGRCCGCTLGKPVEGWPRQKIEAYLRSAGSYPLSSYFPVRKPFLEGLELKRPYPETTLGNVRYMTRDDDIDYTILNLQILKMYGRGFTSDQLATAVITSLPFNMVYTAEAIAYRNVINGMHPPRTASFRNPFQEWIGAQIRADLWGYVNPGRPEKAAEMAWRDASYSHTKNGIYGEMWAAACIAAAFVTDNPREIVLAGLEQIPDSSRLAEAVRLSLEWVEELQEWEAVWDKIQTVYGSYSSLHVIPNTCLIVMGLVLGKGDLGTSICTTVMGGNDTDCTGATVGSIVGAMRGSQSLAKEWTGPLQDRVKSLVPGFQDGRISDLARETAVLAEREA